MTASRPRVRALGLAALVPAGLALALSLSPARGGLLAQLAQPVLASTCHQQPERSLRVDGRPLLACARCTGVHAAAAVVGLALLASGRTLRPAGRAVAAALALVAAEAAAGMALPWWDFPLLRLATGFAATAVVLLAGAGPLAGE